MLIRKTKLPMQELELKMQGAYVCVGGGVIAGFYGISTGRKNSKVHLTKNSYIQVHMCICGHI